MSEARTDTTQTRPPEADTGRGDAGGYDAEVLLPPGWAGIGRTSRAAWTLTSTVTDAIDVFVEVDTDQMGESRLDRNVKRFFVTLHRQADPTHRLEAAY